jgi:DNA-directed RNA polymerase subunit RPC12/RpoP
MSDRDATTTVKCPECGRKIATLSPCVKTLVDPEFRCRCGQRGTLVWRRGTDAAIRGRARKDVAK